MANGDPAAARERPLIPITLEEELCKNPQLKEQDVALLRDWVYMQPHLPPVHDRELALFLHLSDYSVEAAKWTTDTVMTLRTHLTEFFAERDPTLTDIQIAANRTLYTILPKTTPEGYSVFFHRSVDLDPAKFHIFPTLKLFLMVIDLWLLSEGTTPGLVYVCDLKGITMAHLAGMSIVALKKFFMMQLHVHAKLSDFFKYVPQDVLPEEFGGSAPGVMKLNERMQSQLLANREYFLAEEQRRVDETKRPGRPRSAEDLFGVEGTFKKLDID